jgi:hypothetical protein
MQKAALRSKETAVAAAKKYVNQQLATMKKYGSAPTLTPEAYNALVRKVVQATK